VLKRGIRIVLKRTIAARRRIRQSETASVRLRQAVRSRTIYSIEKHAAVQRFHTSATASCQVN
jgi:hypothetical protein